MGNDNNLKHYFELLAICLRFLTMCQAKYSLQDCPKHIKFPKGPFKLIRVSLKARKYFCGLGLRLHEVGVFTETVPHGGFFLKTPPCPDSCKRQKRSFF